MKKKVLFLVLVAFLMGLLNCSKERGRIIYEEKVKPIQFERDKISRCAYNNDVYRAYKKYQLDSLAKVDTTRLSKKKLDFFEKSSDKRQHELSIILDSLAWYKNREKELRAAEEIWINKPDFKHFKRLVLDKK